MFHCFYLNYNNSNNQVSFMLHFVQETSMKSQPITPDHFALSLLTFLIIVKSYLDSEDATELMQCFRAETSSTIIRWHLM